MLEGETMIYLGIGILIGLAALITIYKMLSGIRSTMFHLFTGPVLTGILVFLFIYFISPEITSESAIISFVAEFILTSSNTYFDPMPSIIATYITRLNLLLVGISSGLLITIFFQVIGGLIIIFTFIKYRIIHFFEDRRKNKKLDLPPIDMDRSYKQAKKEEVILARGMDPIDYNK
ncbi:MAG: hypothetical protein ABFS05_12670 [Bacteroidota bacterium]